MLRDICWILLDKWYKIKNGKLTFLFWPPMGTSKRLNQGLNNRGIVFSAFRCHVNSFGTLRGVYCYSVSVSSSRPCWTLEEWTHRSSQNACSQLPTCAAAWLSRITEISTDESLRVSVAGIFLFSKASITAVVPNHPATHWVPETLYAGGKVNLTTSVLWRD